MKDELTEFHLSPLATIAPRDGEVIIHSFDPNKGPEYICEVHSLLTKHFPKNMVISIPNTDSIHLLDKKSTIEFLQSMASLIESLE